MIVEKRSVLSATAFGQHGGVRPLWLMGLLAAVCLVWVLSLRDEQSAPPAPDFSEVPAGKERKVAFFAYLLPLIEARNSEILHLRQQLEAWAAAPDAMNSFDESRLQAVVENYGLEPFAPSDTRGWDELLRRVDVVPPSLALAQAANESAWGTSRFAREGNNYYGQWCFTNGCGLVPSARGAGQGHEVKVFDSAAASVSSYIHNLNTHQAYRELRQHRAQLREQGKMLNGPALTPGLRRYSERGEHYIQELNAMIAFNNLDQYDGQVADNP